MAVRLVVAVTDRDWFGHLSQSRTYAEVNFRAPSATNFKALSPGELFLFKLHAPTNVIVGGGVFAYATNLPSSLAWEAFGEANGATSLHAMRDRIMRYRRVGGGDRSDFAIGCRILTQPFFLPQSAWIAVPPSWAPNIVSFKTYTTDDPDGWYLWGAVQSYLPLADNPDPPLAGPRYGEPVLVRPQLGQGTFRVLVTDIYHRRCAVTGEKTLPALDAAHIRPYGEGGDHVASNGLLLRRDIHSLFDAGYVTVTPSLRFEVSKRIREEFENGRHYYELHGSRIATPDRQDLLPDPGSLSWHNERRFLG